MVKLAKIKRLEMCKNQKDQKLCTVHKLETGSSSKIRLKILIDWKNNTVTGRFLIYKKSLRNDYKRAHFHKKPHKNGFVSITKNVAPRASS